MVFQLKNSSSENEQSDFKPVSHIKYVLLSVAGILIIGTAILVFFYIKDRYEKKAELARQEQNEIPVLPANPDDPEGDKNGNGQSDVRAEELLFGDFYTRPESPPEPSFSDYELPINAKNEVLNYYSISRKIDIDSVLNELNESGFAIINNPFPAQNNFFALYQELYKKDIPIFISGDFLFYYFQNSLKNIYKNIERDIFFRTVWSTSKKMFDAAEARYKQKVNALGQINDPEVEGSRLVAAYWAAILKILMPEKSQVGTIKEQNKFTEDEAALYSFSIPDYLEDDVREEIELIRLAKEKTKSPVKRYFVDYTAYEVPENYRRDAKLYNFYQASRWMNSVLPINYIEESCENCLIDKDDWKIYMIAAGLIANDFEQNQDVKNQWAKIYKIVSFFSGLRNDLTYLNYAEAMRENFGKDYDIDSIFSLQNENRDQALEGLRQKLNGYKFSSLESGLNRDRPENKPFLGLRVLQEAYWPNEYIFQKLIFPYVKNFTLERPDRNSNITYCDLASEKSIARCRGIALDIINLIHPVNENSYFTENTSYLNYEAQAKQLSEMLNNFNDHTWHSNSYWIALLAGKYYLGADSAAMPVFTRSWKWEERRINAVIGAWMNAGLPGDSLLPSADSESAGGFGSLSRCNEYNYIEPNLPLLQEMAADAKMLYDFFEALKIYNEQNNIKNELGELKDTLDNLRGIAAKELKGEEISTQEYCYLENLIKDYYVDKQGQKEARAYFDYEGRQTYIKQSLRDMDLILVVHKKDDGLALTAGPLFEYTETR